MEDQEFEVDAYMCKIWRNNNGDPYKRQYPDGFTSWWNEFGRHRENGPAIEWGSFKQWWYNGEQLNCTNQEEFEKILKLELFW